MKSSGYQEVSIRHQMAPLIDIVFLLLIYFMVTAAIIRPEGDIPFALPVPGPGLDWPVEAYIQIAEDGMVTLEGMQFSKTDHALRALVDQLAVLQQMADAQQSDFIVTLAPDGDALHGRVVDVMDACRDAKVRLLGFAREQT